MEARGKLKSFGAPFDTNYSSCSNLKPTLFDWTDEDSDIEVYIDYSIIQKSFSVPKKPSVLRVGWLCESVSIFRNLYEYIKNNYKYVFTSVDFIFTSDKYLLSLDPRFLFAYSCSNVPWTPKNEWDIYKKTKTCSMICSNKKMCKEHLYRHAVAQLYKDKIDIYGGAFDSPYTGPKHNGFYKKENSLKNYMFSIVIQNNFDAYFFAELLTDCFAFGTVPIYLGNPEINKFFDAEGIIQYKGGFDITILNEDLYNSKMQAIKNNLEKIKSMPMSDDYLYDQCLKIYRGEYE